MANEKLGILQLLIENKEEKMFICPDCKDEYIVKDTHRYCSNCGSHVENKIKELFV